MTLKEIEKRIAEIRALKGDPDSAWLKEIKLYIDTLKAVVELMPNTRAGKLAAAALQATRSLPARIDAKDGRAGKEAI